MVQMKEEGKTLKERLIDLLYIPHGSDESASLPLSKCSLIPLYPTWFR